MKTWVKNRLIPYMTLKHPNRKHSVYRVKHIAEKQLGRYVSQAELQAVLAAHGYPISNYYPISESFFKEDSNYERNNQA